MHTQELPSYKTIWKISFPILLSLIAQNVVNVTDTAFLGRVGEVELGASAIAGLFYISLFMLGFGFGIGGQILIGRRNGEKNYSEIGKITDNSLYFLMLLAFVLFGFIFFFAPALLKPIIKSPAIYAATMEFLDYRIYGLFFAFFNILLRSFYVGTTRTSVLTYNALIMAVVNIVLDYAMIFGHWGFQPMGIKGAALASVIAEFASALFFLLYTIAKVDLKKYNLFRFKKADLAIIRNTLNISVFVMMQYFISLAAWFAFFMIVEKMGERPLAISNIIRSAYLVLMIPIFALGSTANTLVSNIIGQGNHHLVMGVINKVVKMNTVLIGTVIIISMIIPRFFISIYTSNAELIEQTVPTFYVICTALLLFSMASILFNGVSGTANTNVAMVIEVITIAIYLFIAWLLAVVLRMPLTVVWMSEFVYFVVMGILSYIYLRSGKWKHKVV